MDGEIVGSVGVWCERRWFAAGDGEATKPVLLFVNLLSSLCACVCSMRRKSPRRPPSASHRKLSRSKSQQSNLANLILSLLSLPKLTMNYCCSKDCCCCYSAFVPSLVSTSYFLFAINNLTKN